MNLSAFQRRCRTPVTSAANAWTKRLPARPLRASYHLAGMTTRFLQRAFQALSSLIPPLRCAPYLECTQFLYDFLIRQTFPMGTYPSRSLRALPGPPFYLYSPPSLSSPWQCLPALVYFELCLATLARPAAPPSYSPPPSRPSSDIAPPHTETGRWHTASPESGARVYWFWTSTALGLAGQHWPAFAESAGRKSPQDFWWGFPPYLCLPILPYALQSSDGALELCYVN